MLRRRVWPIFFALQAAVAAAAPEPVATALLAWETGAGGAAKARKLTLAGAPPDGVEPPADLGRPGYASVPIDAQRSLALALDLEAGHARFWIDADLDKNLAEETPVVVQPPGAAWSVERSIALALPGEPTPVSVVFRFYRTATCAADHVHLFARLRRSGETILAGRLRPVALVDGNSDLRFDDPQADAVLLDLDGDGRLDESLERLAIGRPFRLRDRGFVARVPLASGRAVEFFAAKTAPPAAPRRWRKRALSRFSMPARPPAESFAELRVRWERAKGAAYAQRLALLRLLAALRNDEAGEFLLAVARTDEHAGLRAQAVRALADGAYAARTKRILALARAEGDPGVAGAALLALHAHAYPGREALFCDRLMRSSKSQVVAAAAEGLVRMGLLEPVVVAARRLADPNLRRQAYLALRYAEAGPPLDLALESARAGAEPLRASALEDLVALGRPEARARALEAAASGPKSLLLARTVAQVLGRAGDPESIRALFDMLDAAPEAATSTAADELGRVRDPAATAEFVRALRHDSARVRALAAGLLGALPGRDTTDALLGRLRKEKDPDALQAVLEALGEHRDPRVAPALIAAARRRDPAVRGAAIAALARLGPGSDDVRAFFLRLLDARRWEDRVHALDAAHKTANRAVVGKVIANLDHKVWQVRHAAAEALADLRRAEAIEPMIRRLEREEIKRVRAALADALFRTTGTNLYDFADVWWKWWRDHKRGFRVPEKVPVRRPSPQGGTVASFYGLPLDSGRVVFVIDESGSMSAREPNGKTRLETAVDEVLGAVARLKARDRINIVFFETGVHAWRRGLTPLKRGARADLEGFLKRRRPTGGTNLFDGLALALADPDVDTVFLLSDGAPSGGRYVRTDDILRAVRRLNRTRRIAIHCVSVGTQSDLLKRLAAANGGKYVRR